MGGGRERGGGERGNVGGRVVTVGLRGEGGGRGEGVEGEGAKGANETGGAKEGTILKGVGGVISKSPSTSGSIPAHRHARGQGVGKRRRGAMKRGEGAKKSNVGGGGEEGSKEGRRRSTPGSIPAQIYLIFRALL